jgi:hypothetical protein
LWRNKVLPLECCRFSYLVWHCRLRIIKIWWMHRDLSMLTLIACFGVKHTTWKESYETYLMFVWCVQEKQQQRGIARVICSKRLFCFPKVLMPSLFPHTSNTQPIDVLSLMIIHWSEPKTKLILQKLGSSAVHSSLTFITTDHTLEWTKN